MGSDDLFHKRKAIKATQLARRKSLRDPYAKVLIVCEGEKSEPNYFNGFKDHYGLNSANVEVCGECNSDPLSIVRFAIDLYRKERNAGDSFDRVYCVFDKDTHANYQSALDQINRAVPKETIFAITSVPCFEYWLLLHFQYTTRPYEALPGNSAGNQLLRDLKAVMPDYEKGKQNIFPALLDQLEFAKHNAVRALEAGKSGHTDNPTTHVHKLVEYLQKIKGHGN
ncbi:MAG: RloB family protein [Mariprofundus sp.]|nr:RloB family protein [Mariprofundus sp.]